MNGKIILNQDVLLPEHVPQKLLFRTTEYQELATSVKNRVSLLLVGPVGSGKTSMVKLLQRELGADRVVYVDCLVRDTEYAVLKEIVPTVRAAFLRSSFELIEELRRISADKKMIVCFDNFVKLEDADVIGKVMTLGITCVLISSVERDLNVLNGNGTPKLASIIRLRNYSINEAHRILQTRAEQGLVAGSYDDDLLKSIIDSTDGNITLGMNVLRAAALKSSTEGRSKIEPVDLQGLLPKQADLDLTEDERVIMGILRERRTLEHGQLYTLYCKSSRAPKQERTFRNYMQKLVAKSLAKLSFPNGLRVYEAV